MSTIGCGPEPKNKIQRATEWARREGDETQLIPFSAPEPSLATRPKQRDR